MQIGLEEFNKVKENENIELWFIEYESVMLLKVNDQPVFMY